jgi:GNAT superfamily N-acetyltransferase
MTSEEIAAQKAGVDLYGYYEGGELIAVMGIQPIKDVTLIRHAYVRTSHQRRGIGEKLLQHLLSIAKTNEVLVGTWAAAGWALRFYQKNGFQIVPRESRSKLRQYWNIPDRQAETSIVLRLQRTV